MYLREIYIENSGPVRSFSFSLPFTNDGKPKPVILVGENGGGKTNLLSVIADALIIAASTGFDDIVPSVGINRPWFRVVGPGTVTVGTTGGCTILRFDHGDQTYWFREKAGRLAHQDVLGRAPETMRGVPAWEEEGNIKDFHISQEAAKQAIGSGAYVYYPSSRAEIPHWLNTESIKDENFDFNERFASRLGRPIFVERSLDQVRQWLMALLTDAHMERHAGPALWRHMNDIITTILGRNARLGWAGRKSHHRLTIQADGSVPLPSLTALSAGQATLLSVFGTLLRYGDAAISTLSGPEDVTGICLIDEIDAHLHISLQHVGLPALVKMFPNVQFILSSHSPLFALGMEKLFGADGMCILELPLGIPIQAEAYSEFGHALSVLQDTRAFNAAVQELASRPGKFLVLLEGETDPKYMRTAAELLDRRAIVQGADFEWIGSKDPKTGQGVHTGKDALNQTLNFLRSKPDLINRPILLLYDNDANKLPADFGQVHVRTMPKNPNNTRFKGIENLFDPTIVPDAMFDKKEKQNFDGGETITKTLNKMRLCIHLCDTKRDPADFGGFLDVLDMIEQLMPKPSPPDAP
jgi:hypothetical protein